MQACNQQTKTQDEPETTAMPRLQVSDFGEAEGEKVKLYKITFPDKLEAELTNYGGIIISLKIPDKEGKLEDVVLGYNNLDGYLKKTPYFGALVGRYGNRIAQGKFSLNGKKYTLAQNNGPNSLHGGTKGFDKVVWTVADTTISEVKVDLKLTYISPDGEEGFPGNLSVAVVYSFTADGLSILYQATTDQPTVVNLTQHTYFNLAGNTKNNILNHQLMLNADAFLPVDSTLIPTGEKRAVEGTPFNFTEAKVIGRDINTENQQLAYGGGYDHCWVLNNSGMNKVAASVYHPPSGRYMEVFTQEPGIQFYSGNFLDGSIIGKNGNVYQHRSGLCLETQHFPDSPNQPEFPSVVLKPGEKYSTQTRYQFSVK